MRQHCPVKALLFYLDKTKSIREDIPLLFSYNPGQLDCQVQKSHV